MKSMYLILETVNLNKEYIMSKEIANTIYQQIGGNKTKVMIGMKNLIAIENGLQFDFKMCKKANKCQIVLNGMDLYDVKFFKFYPRRLNNPENTMEDICPMVHEVNDVYNDQLIDIFEKFTGLATKLF
jgi:hypothetical protein